MSEENNQPSQPRGLSATDPCHVTFYSDAETGEGTSMHFSERGILVLCARPLPINSKVKLSLSFPGIRHAIDVQGEVVWTNVYGSNDPLTPRGMGVRFTSLERDTERLLGELAGQFEVMGNMYACYYT